jgi:hypothetical protein
MTARTPGPPLTEDERAELTWLRAENDLLRVERDILLRVASGYARDTDTARRHTHPEPHPMSVEDGGTSPASHGSRAVRVAPDPGRPDGTPTSDMEARR